MNEALKRNTSITAMAVAAGMLFSMTSAFAADLGGNCCADLEERVAELEATTARKGTRKTSLEIWGNVNKAILAWDDGKNRNTIIGTDNVNYSTRFGLRGNAKLSSELSTGYSIVFEMATGGRSSNISQFTDKSAAPGTSGTGSYNGSFGTNDPAVTMRESSFWIESSRLGRVTLGRLSVGADGGPQGVVDLAGIGLTAAGSSESLLGTGLVFRTGAAPAAIAGAGTGNYSNYSIATTTDAAGQYGTRENAIAWNSPTLAGFILTASYGGAVSADSQCANAACTANFGYGPTWGLGLKYANEFHGVRLAAAVGYEDAKSENNTSLSSTAGTSVRPDSTNFGLSLSMLHVPTGLFAQGMYNEFTRGHDSTTTVAGVTTPSAFAAAGITKDTAKQWLVQAGVKRNWFGYGDTVFYGEYGQTTNGANTFSQFAPGSATFGVAPGTVGAVAYFGDNTKNTVWGLGMVQNIDGGAVQLYSGYRNFSLTSGNCAAAGGCKDIGMFVDGARISF